MCYNESTKERSDRIDSKEKSRISDRADYLRNYDAVLRSSAWRGRNRVKQGNPAVFGVCGNWITKNRRKKEAVYRSFSHAFDGLFKQEQLCWVIFICRIYWRAEFIKAKERLFAFRDWIAIPALRHRVHAQSARFRLWWVRQNSVFHIISQDSSYW